MIPANPEEYAITLPLFLHCRSVRCSAGPEVTWEYGNGQKSSPKMLSNGSGAGETYPPANPRSGESSRQSMPTSLIGQ